ncbi:substrate-binding periplasmic protein [Pseudoalteromonas xiamenensis]
MKGSLMRWWWSVLFAIYSWSVHAVCYTVMVYHGANPPYSFESNSQFSGLFVDIFDEISAQTGLCFEYLPVSVARGQRLFEKGEIDIEPGVSPTWRQESTNPGIYSYFYARSREIILARVGPVLTSPEQLYGQVMGRVRGYRYGAFEVHFNRENETDKITVYDNTSERELLAQLYHQRFNYMMVGDITADYYKLTQPEYRGFQEVYEISNLPVAMRLQPHLSQLRDTLNRVLEKMVESGDVARIYAQYGSRMDDARTP